MRQPRLLQSLPSAPEIRLQQLEEPVPRTLAPLSFPLDVPLTKTRVRTPSDSTRLPALLDAFRRPVTAVVPVWEATRPTVGHQVRHYAESAGFLHSLTNTHSRAAKWPLRKA